MASVSAPQQQHQINSTSTSWGCLQNEAVRKVVSFVLPYLVVLGSMTVSSFVVHQLLMPPTSLILFSPPLAAVATLAGFVAWAWIGNATIPEAFYHSASKTFANLARSYRNESVDEATRTRLLNRVVNKVRIGHWMKLGAQLGIVGGTAPTLLTTTLPLFPHVGAAAAVLSWVAYTIISREPLRTRSDLDKTVFEKIGKSAANTKQPELSAKMFRVAHCHLINLRDNSKATTASTANDSLSRTIIKHLTPQEIISNFTMIWEIKDDQEYRGRLISRLLDAQHIDLFDPSQLPQETKAEPIATFLIGGLSSLNVSLASKAKENPSLTSIETKITQFDTLFRRYKQHSKNRDLKQIIENKFKETRASLKTARKAQKNPL